MATTVGVQPLGLSNISRWYRQRQASGLSTPQYMLTSALKAQLEVDADKAAERQAREDANELAESQLALGYAGLDAQKAAAKAAAKGDMVSGIGQLGTMGLIMNKDTVKNSFLGDMFFNGGAGDGTEIFDSVGNDVLTGGVKSVGGDLLTSSIEHGAASPIGTTAAGTTGAQATVTSASQHTAVALPSTAPSQATSAAIPAGGSLGGTQAAEVGFNNATMGVIGGAGIGALGGGLLGNAIGGKTGGIVGSVAGGAIGGFMVGMQAGSVGGPAGAVIGGVVGGVSSLIGGGK